ncbi:MAG: hypothetical protein J0I12_19935 [Candidatus Eremiobacteraeota bacterium]|nr:hypothetical protein [Candidatus Eremiobacteraeota bacterium]
MSKPLVGILGPKNALPEALLSALARRGMDAEWCKISPWSLESKCPYRVIIDRISHVYEFYRPYLKAAALQGCYVMNNPFWFLADDKFFNYTLAQGMGVAIPKTVLLPSREYDERVLAPEDLHNLENLEIQWDEVERQVGLPAILKPYDGYGWREVHRIDNRQQLVEIYNDSMGDVMMLQEFIDFEHYVRCFVVGGKYVLPTSYDPVQRRYIVDHDHLSPGLGERIVSDCIKLNQALGYDINTVEFAIRDGVPYAIDFMNPVPDARPEVISGLYFTWLVERICDFVEEVIREDRQCATHLVARDSQFVAN